MIISKWQSLSPVQQFLTKIIVSVIAWKWVYVSFLQPIRVPDRWLTILITQKTAAVINWLNPSKIAAHVVINDAEKAAYPVRGSQYLIGIYDGCNGLELILMYAALIAFLPYPFKRQLVFICLGAFVLFWVNVFRCVALQWIYVNHQSLFETTHHYLFTLVFYAFIFLGWYLFVQKKPSLS
ncbi:MAG: exosortase/archaeosortase family protein [Chitinophagaceae bacterium]